MPPLESGSRQTDPSLVPRLSSHTMTTKSKERKAWYPFADDATEQTSWIYQ